MTSPIAKKCVEIYTFVREQLYRCREDLEVGEVRFNSTLLFLIIGFILRRAVLLYGDPGSGKTTSAELVGSMMAGIPLPALVSASIRGSPGLTEEVLTRLDLGKLALGVEEVVPASFVTCPVHIIDELSRIPEIKTACMLEGIRTGRWVYLGHLVATGRKPLFATLNYEAQGAGTFGLTAALADRFSLATEAGYAGVHTVMEIADRDTEAIALQMGLADRTDEAIQLLNRRPFDPLAIAAFCEEFKVHLASKGVPVLTAADLDQALSEIESIPIGRGPDDLAVADRHAADSGKLRAADDPWSQAGWFRGFLFSALNHCARHGAKRSARPGDAGGRQSCPEDCRFVKSSCSGVVDGGSRRQERDITLASKALAWIMGEPSVELKHIVAAAPHCLFHRRQFSRELLAKAGAARRTGPVQLEAAKLFVASAQREFLEMEELLRDFTLRSRQQKLELPAGLDALIELGGQKAVRIRELHPFFHDLAEDSFVGSRGRRRFR